MKFFILLPLTLLLFTACPLSDPIPEPDNDPTGDEYGRMVAIYSRDSDGIIQAHTDITYDSEGHVLIVTPYDETNQPEGFLEHEYNSDGQLILQKSYDENNVWIEFQEFEYDALGHCIWEKEYDVNTSLVEPVEATKTTYNVLGFESWVEDFDYSDPSYNRVTNYVYGADDLLTEEYHYEGIMNNKTLLYWYQFDYYDNGNPLKSEKYDPIDLDSYVMYDYNGSGYKEAEYHFSINMTGDHIRDKYYTYVYDSQGEEIRKNKYDDSDTLQKYFTYGYDTSGNLIEYSYYNELSLLQEYVEMEYQAGTTEYPVIIFLIMYTLFWDIF
jgi:hypothetical protein